AHNLRQTGPMPLLLLIAFIVVPIVELWVIIQVGQVIGLVPTVLLLIAISATGAWLVRREGLKAWRRFRTALDQARIPAAEVVDGALVMLGGALMLTPGFVSDVFGLLLVAPPSRALVNRAIRTRVRWSFGIPGVAPRRPTKPMTVPDDPVDVEVVDVKRTQSRD
ncbi:MAG: FxsA family protein, partial [Egibacteraceae bacterium]